MQVKPTDFKFEVLQTADGSPSIRLWQKENSGEAMHHLGGAFSETLYVYDSAIRDTLALGEHLAVLSVGLGLGYNEWLAAGRALLANSSFYMESFESEENLRSLFLNWLHEDHSPEPWKSIYDKVLHLVCGELGVLPKHLKGFLSDCGKDGSWLLRSKLDSSVRFDQKFNCILFDAFSSGSTPDLWTEEFLHQFIKDTAATPCVFSTYAATGALKRALTSNQFQVELRPGFSGKRHSTWAQRITEPRPNFSPL